MNEAFALANLFRKFKCDNISFIHQQTQYESHLTDLSQTKNEKFPFTETELDMIDDECEKTIADFHDHKIDMFKKLKDSYEKIKQKLIKLLDRQYDSIETLVKKSSKYVIYERLVSEFQDAKNDYEMEMNPSNSSTLLNKIENLFGVCDMTYFKQLVDNSNINSFLFRIEEYFNRAIKFIWQSCDSEKYGIYKKLKSNSFETIKKLYEIGKLDLFYDSVASNDEKLQTDFKNLLKSNEQIQKLKSRIKPMTLSVEKDYNFDMDLLQNHIKNLVSNNLIFEYKCFPVSRNRWILASDSTIHFDENPLYTVKEKLKRYFRLDLLEISDDDEINNLSLIRLEAVVDNIIVSPSKRYISVFLSKIEVVVFDISQDKFSRIPALRKMKLMSSCFVDFPGEEKLVCTNYDGELFDFSLKKKQITHISHIMIVRYVYYLDSRTILVNTYDHKFAFFSLETYSYSNFILLSNKIINKKIYVKNDQNKSTF
jgi:hypothetical protein